MDSAGHHHIPHIITSNMNRLQHEISPYLLQHAHNPVDWYAWRPEAFERAQAEQKPILVSIGYSTCHWCHVMERESFEDEAVAAYMNAHFVNIKVDREERPDVDAIYMEACQLLTGGGGWPLNCFLTPDGKPFYAGTYFPPRPAHNRPSWLHLLQHLSGIWDTQRDVALQQAEKLLGHIRQNDDVLVQKMLPDAQPSDEALSRHTLDRIFFQMRERFDREEGGFGGAPKFPSTMSIQYLLNYHWHTGSSEALEHALLSLDKMIHGGIYDQIGGGFARYATDREWLVPHFEKMLYDNALLVTVLSEAHKLLKTKAPASSVSAVNRYAQTIEETLEYIEREMTTLDGGFYAAQDADSEGVEGKFYVWDPAEVEQVLGEEAALFCAFYDITAQGNWEGKSIPWRLASYEQFAEGIHQEVEWLQSKLRSGREKLFAVRARRIPPGLDNKVLLSWNALMCTAYTHAFTALGHEKYRQAAARNLDFLIQNFTVNGQDTTTLQPIRHSLSQPDAFLEDYAYLIAALVDVYQITFEAKYLQLAGKYTDYVLSSFYDSESGLFFFTDAGQSDIVLRKKDLYDNATPSGNSTMAHNLQRLGILLDQRAWRERASDMLLRMKKTVENHPLAFERWATAMMNEVHPAYEIAVVGENALEKAQVLQTDFLPNKVFAASREASDSIPLLDGKPGAPDALIYVCRDFACQKPVCTLEEFRHAIRS